jgi:protein-arginine deiminase
MRSGPRSILLASVLLAACSTDVIDAGGGSPTDPKVGTNGTDPSTATATSDRADQARNEDLGGIVADLRADTNRDGVVSFDDRSDDDGEDRWDARHGAIFLANIDDDEVTCDANVDDVDLPKCNDAADEVINGADDALDLARLKTKPWPGASSGTVATITFTAEDKVRLFKVKNGSFSVLRSGSRLSLSEVRSGVELAIEGKDIVRDPAAWDGYVDITLQVDADGASKADVVRMRVAPLITYHHLLPAESTWVSSFQDRGNKALRADLAKATAAAGVPATRGIDTTDSWAQDFFETGFMSMPAPGGEQRVIRVNIRSANEFDPQSTANPLRPAGRFAFTMRGKDSAAIQEYDKTRNGRNDSLNSFGNFETVPPYTYGGQSFPLGRVLRGQTRTVYPDKVFQKMIEAQQVQPPIYVDTSWLLVGHVDETMSFVKANTPRGWVLLVNDARMAKSMFTARSTGGQGSTPMFIGKYWDTSTNNSTSYSPAQVTIDQVLSDTDVMSASAEAAVEVDGQIEKLKQEAGLTDAEIVHIPFLHMTIDGHSIAYQPGMVNGLYLSDSHFVAPDPHGPVIAGQDIFKAAMTDALAPYDITVHFAEDWDTYHREMGEVHCGTNSIRQIPVAKWWESGR